MDIKEIINQRYAMPDVSLDRLQQCLTEVSYPKGFRVLKCGKVEKDIFFIKQGIVRAYTSVDGKEITFWVGKEGATLVSMKGYVNDEPGYETMELMEDSVLYVLKRKKLKELFSEDLHIANWGRRYAEMELLATEERLISMLCTTLEKVEWICTVSLRLVEWFSPYPQTLLNKYSYSWFM